MEVRLNSAVALLPQIAKARFTPGKVGQKVIFSKDLIKS